MIENGNVIPAGAEAWVSVWGAKKLRKVEPCANEAYDQAASDEDKNAPRFISCHCPKCSVSN